MAVVAPDRLLWLGVGLGTCLVSGLIYKVLDIYRQAALPVVAVNLGSVLGKNIDQSVENEIRCATLEKLVESSNYSIKNIAGKILCDRAVRDDQVILDLLWQASRPEYEIRLRALRTLLMLAHVACLSALHRPATYDALVRCLELCIDDYEHNSYDAHWDNWNGRDEVERACLQLLAFLVDRFGVQGLIDTDFVARWLKAEPWGYTTHLTQSNFLAALGSTQWLGSIIRSLFLNPQGRRELKIHGLLSTRFPDCDAEGNDNDGIAGRDGTMGEVELVNVYMSRPRNRQIGLAEDEIRRRHREAMVFNDGTRPFDRSDIIER